MIVHLSPSPPNIFWVLRSIVSLPNAAVSNVKRIVPLGRCRLLVETFRPLKPGELRTGCSEVMPSFRNHKGLSGVTNVVCLIGRDRRDRRETLGYSKLQICSISPTQRAFSPHFPCSNSRATLRCLFRSCCEEVRLAREYVNPLLSARPP